MEYRYQEVMRYRAVLMNKRKIAYSPIVDCHEMAKTHSLPRDINYWWEYNRMMIDRSNEFHLLTLEGWEESKGVMRELGYIKDSVFYAQPPQA